MRRIALLAALGLLAVYENADVIRQSAILYYGLIKKW